MRKYSLLYIAFGLLVILWILNFIALEFYFYWNIWWYDLMMHTLAGFSGGLIAFWFAKTVNISRPFLFALVSLMVVGIVWEVFEYVFEITPMIDYWQDTITDLIADGVGASLACFFARGQTP